MTTDEQTAADLADVCDRIDEAAAQDVWEEMRTLAAERDAATVRAEAAEQRAEAAEAALAAARADALILLAECHSADVADGGDFFGSAGMLAQAGLTRAELARVRMLPVSGDDPAALLAVIRRALGGAR